eukprot:3639703-Rhodomonas_salina.1
MNLERFLVFLYEQKAPPSASPLEVRLWTSIATTGILLGSESVGVFTKTLYNSSRSRPLR